MVPQRLESETHLVTEVVDGKLETLAYPLIKFLCEGSDYFFFCGEYFAIDNPPSALQYVQDVHRKRRGPEALSVPPHG